MVTDAQSPFTFTTLSLCAMGSNMRKKNPNTRKLKRTRVSCPDRPPDHPPPVAPKKARPKWGKNWMNGESYFESLFKLLPDKDMEDKMVDIRGHLRAPSCFGTSHTVYCLWDLLRTPAECAIRCHLSECPSDGTLWRALSDAIRESEGRMSQRYRDEIADLIRKGVARYEKYREKRRKRKEAEMAEYEARYEAQLARREQNTA